MSQAEQEAYIAGIRERRLATVREWEAAAEVKKKAKDEKTRQRIEKESAMIEKELAALDKALDKVEKRANTLMALRLMVENQV